MLFGRRITQNKASFDLWKGQMIRGKYTLYRKRTYAWLQIKLAAAWWAILILSDVQVETLCALGIHEHAVKIN